VTADDLLIAVAGLVAGFVNGVAGGGSLISFPALVATGQSALVANITSTVGIWTGYVGGVAGFRTELADQRGRVRALAPAALAGGLAGSLLLLVTPEGTFDALAPFLILAACALFAAQPRITAEVRRRAAAAPPSPAPLDRRHPNPDPAPEAGPSPGWRPGSGPAPTRSPVPPGSAPSRPSSVRAVAAVGTFAGGVYGGYFGGGLGVVLLTVLGLSLDDELNRINGLRGVLAMLVNSLAVVVFVASGEVVWRAAAVLAVAALVGGYAGARLSRRLPVPVLRAAVIALGIAAAVAMLA